jgi:septum formation protein
MLASLGMEVQVVASGVSESMSGGHETPGGLAGRWALAKARRVAGEFPGAWVLAADTVVALEGHVFGKPSDPTEALSMLRALSGKTHRVFSGMALVHLEQGVSRETVVCTSVTFRILSLDEMLAYVRTGEPFDKAGGYGIQGLGAFLVQSIEGSYTNVVGLPLGEALDWLLEHGIIKPR